MCKITRLSFKLIPNIPKLWTNIGYFFVLVTICSNSCSKFNVFIHALCFVAAEVATAVQRYQTRQGCGHLEVPSGRRFNVRVCTWCVAF